jgi:hypothetical protein
MVPPAILSLRASYLLKGRFRRIRRSNFIDEVETLSPRAGRSLLRDRGSRHRRTFAVEFSKTSAVSVRRRKKDLRLAPGGLRVRIVAYTSRAWRLLWSSYRAFLRTPVRTAWEV